MQPNSQNLVDNKYCNWIMGITFAVSNSKHSFNFDSLDKVTSFTLVARPYINSPTDIPLEFQLMDSGHDILTWNSRRQDTISRPSGHNNSNTPSQWWLTPNCSELLTTLWFCKYSKNLTWAFDNTPLISELFSCDNNLWLGWLVTVTDVLIGGCWLTEPYSWRRESRLACMSSFNMVGIFILAGNRKTMKVELEGD